MTNSIDPHNIFCDDNFLFDNFVQLVRKKIHFTRKFIPIVLIQFDEINCTFKKNLVFSVPVEAWALQTKKLLISFLIFAQCQCTEFDEVQSDCYNFENVTNEIFVKDSSTLHSSQCDALSKTKELK